MLGVLKCAYENCATFFTKLANLRIHVQTEHSKQKKYVCDVSGCNFESSTSLKIHKKQHAMERRRRYLYICQVPGCSSRFLLLEQLSEHTQSSHANSQESKCMLCDKIVLQHALFWPHVSKHQTNKVGVVKCAYATCNKTFTATNDLKKHVKCSHRFLLSANIRLELRANQEPPQVKKGQLFRCKYPDCPLSFELQEKLQEHQQISGVHDHLHSLCMLCGMVMVERSHFWPHIREHQTDVVGVYKCALSNCNLTFRSAKDLKKHVKSCRGEPSAGIEICRLESSKELLMCDVCSDYFSSKGQLQLHILKHLEMAAPDPQLHPASTSYDDLTTNAELEEEDIKIEEVVFD
jgi:hypothetical protein